MAALLGDVWTKLRALHGGAVLHRQCHEAGQAPDFHRGLGGVVCESPPHVGAVRLGYEGRRGAAWGKSVQVQVDLGPNKLPHTLAAAQVLEYLVAARTVHHMYDASRMHAAKGRL